MRRGTNSSLQVELQVFTLYDVNIKYLCLLKIKCAIKCCIFDFFYILKEKHCRSPPSINSQKTNWLEEIEMGNRPKRRKNKDNPYTLLHDERNNTYFVMFKDGERRTQLIEVNKVVYEAMNRFELDDLSEMNEYDNHIEHSEVFEATLNRRILYKPLEIDEIVENDFVSRELKNAINQLSDVQKRRIKMYYFENKTVEEIAVIEKTTHQAVSETIRNGIANISKILKK